MRLLVTLFLIMCLCATSTAKAGPWLRKEGSGFSSVSLSANATGDFASSGYVEYGLREGLTLGTDVGFFTTGEGSQAGYGTLFMRRALGSTTGRNLWAYELGIGTSWTDDLISPHLKTGLTWGRGIEFQHKHGWVTVDAAVLWEVGRGAQIGKLDTTLGLDFTDRTSGMIQLYLAHIDGTVYGTVAPSLLIKVQNSKFRFQIGSDIPMRDSEDATLKLGIWLEF